MILQVENHLTMLVIGLKSIKECKNNSPKSIFMVLVGNKLDLDAKREISSDEGRELAEKN